MTRQLAPNHLQRTRAGRGPRAKVAPVPTVTVHGMGSAPVMPDRVEMILIVTARETTPDAALDRVAERDATLRQILDELGVPEAARITTGATVNERSEYDRETGRETSAGYQAVATLTVKLEAPDSAGRLMREVTSRAGAQVSGPIWRVEATIQRGWTPAGLQHRMPDVGRRPTSRPWGSDSDP